MKFEGLLVYDRFTKNFHVLKEEPNADGSPPLVLPVHFDKAVLEAGGVKRPAVIRYTFEIEL